MALRALAIRWLMLDAEIKEHEEFLKRWCVLRRRRRAAAPRRRAS
jgi:hypothetical protein